MYLKQRAQSSQKLVCKGVKELTCIISSRTYCEIFLKVPTRPTKLRSSAMQCGLLPVFVLSLSLSLSLSPLPLSSALSRALGFCYSESNGRSTNLLIFTPSTKFDVCCVTRSQALSSRRPMNWPSPKRSQSE